MAVSFTVDGKVYQLVNTSQSGEVVKQHQLPLRQRHEIDQFINKLLEQNSDAQPELKRYLGGTSGQPISTQLGDQIEKGQLALQLGPGGGGVGSSRAPQGKSPFRQETPKSRLYSSVMQQFMQTEAGLAGLGANLVNQAGGGTANSSSEKQDTYKMVVEVAGSARCGKQRIALNPLDGEKSQLQGAKKDRNNPHRSLVEFNGVPNSPRKLTLKIPTSGAASDIELPLCDNHPCNKSDTDKPEWDTVLVPVKPLGYVTKQRDRQLTDLLKPGYVYVFWQGKLWRELEVGTGQRLRDVNVTFYRNNWNGDLGQSSQREAEGHWLTDIWVPYKINGETQTGTNAPRMLYSETQLDMPYIEGLESNPDKLAKKSTSLEAVAQYSGSQHFATGNGDVDSIETALQDQDIDEEALGYQVISPKGKHINRQRTNNIPVAYLMPIGEKFVLEVKDQDGAVFANKRFSLDTGSGVIEGVTDQNGVLEIALEEGITEGQIDLWLEDDRAQPSHQLPFKSSGDTLPDVSTVEGLQMRLNNLGYNAGVVDGISGRKTRAATEQFQADNALEVDGISGPKTQGKLKQVYQQ